MNPARLRIPLTTHAVLAVSRRITAGLATFYATPHANPLQTRLHSSSRSLPKIAQASLWQSMIPKFIRNHRSGDAAANSAPPKSKEWNPASFYIIIFILIGSQAIRMIALKNEYSAYTRSTDAKIRLLREVIEKVKNGEQVDVEKLLGTGDEAKEREWDEVLREIEREDSLWHQKSTGSTPQEEQQKQTPVNPKTEEPAVPAKNESTIDTSNQQKRKVNFF